MDVKVSIVMPVYNTSEYIDATMDCLINQTFQNWEAICIDDGSTDGTSDILDRYAESDSRIKVFHKKNEGVSRARNDGIRLVKGEKILFLDSDDIFEKTLISDCMEYIAENGVETVLYGYSDCINGVKGKEHIFELEKKVYRGKREIIQKMMPAFMGISYENINEWIRGKKSFRQGKEHTAMWRIMCDAACIRENNILFHQNLSIGEDTMFMNEYLYLTKSVGVLDKTLYYLVNREGSANWLNNHDIEKMAKNKLLLIAEKSKFSQRVLEETGIDIGEYWAGNNVLSAIQILIGYSKMKNIRFSQRIRRAMDFRRTEEIDKAVKMFCPYRRIKAMPFYFLKYAPAIMFIGLGFVPSKILNKFY